MNFCLVWLYFCFLLSVNTTDVPVNCSFPDNLHGIWISTYNGPLVFDSSTISGYHTDVPNAPDLELNCIEGNGTFYILKSTHIFEAFGQRVHLYLCLEIEEQSSSDVFYYHIRTGYEQILREYIYGHIPANILGEVCDSHIRKPFLLVRNVSIANQTIGNTCPDIIQGYYSNMTSDTCNQGSLGACKKSVDFQLYIENECSDLSGNITFTCLHYLEGVGNYLYTWTNNEDLYSSSSYGFFCIDISKNGNILNIAIFPDYCSKNTSHKALTTITLIDISDQCYSSELTTTIITDTTKVPESSTSPALVVVIVIFVCLSVALTIIFLLHWQRKKLGINCVFRKQTSDNQFDSIS